MINLWPLLLPAAAWSGWFFAIKNYPKNQTQITSQLSKEYVIGLNYLLNEQPDKAVDLFIKILQIDSETIETHMALSSLFRKRGEIDRAIRIHQNLIARPSLSSFDKHQALLALAEDYVCSGLYDTAEKVFNDVLLIDANDQQALSGLLSIYQDQANWQLAIKFAHNLQKRAGKNLSRNIANFYCELAEEAFAQKNMSDAKLYLDNSIEIDKSCARSYLLIAKYFMILSEYQSAIESYKKAIIVDPTVILEAIKPLINCYMALNDLQNGINFLININLKAKISQAMILIAETIELHQGSEAAFYYLTDQLKIAPSISGISKLLKYILHKENNEKILHLSNLLNQIVIDKNNYLCNQCGFKSKTIHWCCPGCKNWCTVKPIEKKF